MSRLNLCCRWAATTLYVVAILGALVVPHRHSHSGACCSSAGCCSHGGECESDEQASHDHSHTDGSICDHDHDHGAHDHDHTGSEGDSNSTDGPVPVRHDDCPLCRFLAQAAQLASAPLLVELTGAVALAPEPLVIAGRPAVVHMPPARGPPAV